jgi:hypothetical protein
MSHKDLAGNRLRALENIEKNKRRVARWYDKNVKGKEFARGSGLETRLTDWI